MRDNIRSLAADCTETKAWLKNLFNLKSIKFIPIYVNTEYFIQKSLQDPCELIIFYHLFILIIGVNCNLHCIYTNMKPYKNLNLKTTYSRKLVRM